MQTEIKAKNIIQALSEEAKKRVLQFDGDADATSTMEEFLTTNLIDKDVDHISLDDAFLIIGLEIGEEGYLPYGFGTLVKRIS